MSRWLPLLCLLGCAATAGPRRVAGPLPASPVAPERLCWAPAGVGVALFLRQPYDAPIPAGAWGVTLRSALDALTPKDPQRGAEVASVPPCEAQP